VSDEQTTLNNKDLKKLLQILKQPSSPARVGVLGSKTMRNTSAQNNATIGARHEFGEEGMPTRSFLRVPISAKLQSYAEKAGAFTPDSLKQVIKEGSFTLWNKKLGAIGEQIVSDAFDTGGFGEWKPSDMRYKKNHQTLVETQQLRNSITSEVSE